MSNVNTPAHSVKSIVFVGVKALRSAFKLLSKVAGPAVMDSPQSRTFLRADETSTWFGASHAHVTLMTRVDSRFDWGTRVTNPTHDVPFARFKRIADLVTCDTIGVELSEDNNVLGVSALDQKGGLNATFKLASTPDVSAPEIPTMEPFPYSQAWGVDSIELIRAVDQCIPSMGKSSRWEDGGIFIACGDDSVTLLATDRTKITRARVDATTEGYRPAKTMQIPRSGLKALSAFLASLDGSTARFAFEEEVTSRNAYNVRFHYLRFRSDNLDLRIRLDDNASLPRFSEEEVFSAPAVASITIHDVMAFTKAVKAASHDGSVELSYDGERVLVSSGDGTETEVFPGRGNHSGESFVRSFNAKALLAYLKSQSKSDRLTFGIAGSQGAKVRMDGKTWDRFGPVSIVAENGAEFVMQPLDVEVVGAAPMVVEPEPVAEAAPEPVCDVEPTPAAETIVPTVEPVREPVKTLPAWVDHVKVKGYDRITDYRRNAGGKAWHPSGHGGARYMAIEKQAEIEAMYARGEATIVTPEPVVMERTIVRSAACSPEPTDPEPVKPLTPVPGFSGSPSVQRANAVCTPNQAEPNRTHIRADRDGAPPTLCGWSMTKLATIGGKLVDFYSADSLIEGTTGFPYPPTCPACQARYAAILDDRFPDPEPPVPGFSELAPNPFDAVEFAPPWPAPICGGSPELDTPPVPVFPDDEWDNGDRPDDDHDTPSSWDDREEPLDPDSTVLDIPVTPEDDHEADEWALYDACESMIIAGSRRSRLAHVEDAIRTILLHILETEVRIGQAARVTWNHRMSAERREDFVEWVEACGITIDPFGDAPTDPAEMFEWLCVECRDGCLVDFPEPTPTPDPDGDDDDASRTIRAEHPQASEVARLDAGSGGARRGDEQDGTMGDREGGEHAPDRHRGQDRLRLQGVDRIAHRRGTEREADRRFSDSGEDRGTAQVGLPELLTVDSTHDSVAHDDPARLPLPAGLRAGHAGQDHGTEESGPDRDREPALPAPGGPGDHGALPRLEAPAPAAGTVEAPDPLTCSSETSSNPFPAFLGGDDGDEAIGPGGRRACGRQQYPHAPIDLGRHHDAAHDQATRAMERGAEGAGLGAPDHDRQRPPALGPAGHDNASLTPDTLTIDGRAYGVSWRLGYFLLEKDERTTYEVATDPLGRPWCSCPDAIHRRNGLDSRGCRHFRGLKDAGLIPQTTPGPFFRQPCPDYLDAAAL